MPTAPPIGSCPGRDTRKQSFPRPLGARGLPRVLGSRSTAPPGLTLGSCPANDASQGPGTRRQALGNRCLGAPKRCSLGVPLPTAPLTGSRPGRDTRRQSFPRPPGDQGLPGPHVSPWSRPPLPPRRLQKVSPGGGRSKPTPSDTQSVRTEQTDDAQGFFGSKTPQWSMAHCCRSSLDSDACRP